MRCRQIPCYPQNREFLRNLNALQSNSLSTKEQGIFSREQGIFSSEQGIFRRIRELTCLSPQTLRRSVHGNDLPAMSAAVEGTQLIAIT
jgi:hypothetical protein